MTLIKLPYNFIPRDYQRAIMKAIFVDKYRHIYSVIHRRAGKTRCAISCQFIYALKHVGMHLFLMPQNNQVRKTIWVGRGSDGIRFIDHIPKCLIKKINNVNMEIELINGSRIIFVGSNNHDGLIGTNPISISYDEFALQNPLARELLSPILLENKGVEFLYTTPRGHNHAYDLYNMAIDNKNWFVQKLTIDDTRDIYGNPIITPEQVEQEELEGKSKELLQQEYYVSFDTGNQGAYYTEEINHAYYEKRILDFDININANVHTSWDLGVRDQTSICLFQQKGDKVHFIGYIEGSDKGMQEYWRELKDLKQRLRFRSWGYHFAPHDIRNREWASSARSRLSMASEIGLHFLVVPNLSIQDRIAAGRAFMRDCVFHKTHCSQLLRCLREAMREYDEINKVYKDKPLHNWALHGFDAYTYGAVAWREQFAKPQDNHQKVYSRSDGIIAPSRIA